MAVLPVDVGYGVAMDRGRHVVRLTSAELSELGHGRYGLLRQFTGYHAARVGWDAEGCVDLDEVRAGGLDDLAPGLALADGLHQELRGRGFTRFAPGHVWIPYRGHRASTLTLDQPI